MRASKAPKDPLGGHIRIYWAMFDSMAWRALSHADVRVYLAMRRKLMGSNNGNINATLTEMKHAGINSSSTLATALHRLTALGFIEVTRQGGITYGGKLTSLYRFTDVDTFDMLKIGVRASKATNAWRRFTTLKQAEAAISNFQPKNASKLRSSNRSASTIEAEAPNSGSIIERGDGVPLRPSNMDAVTRIQLQAA